jgi:HD-GYP domain-containing protein (c-di-GMP phosphodiesterase class II)
VHNRIYSSLWKCQAIRVTCMGLGAIAVIACAMAIKGWQPTSFLLASIIVLLGALLVIQVTRTLASFSRQSSTTRQAASEAEKHYITVLQQIVKFVEGRDKYMAGRSMRIGKLCQAMSEKLHLSPEMCGMMNLAGQLHDIGLLAVPDGVLTKGTKHGLDDYRSIKSHSEVSYEVLKPLGMIECILPAVRYHHERMNGTGYPMGLSQGEIPIEARILAVADAYDAMTHDRPHRGAISPLEAMRELRRCSPAGYDTQCVDTLSEIVNLPEIEAVMKTITPAVLSPQTPDVAMQHAVA